jgi:O-antigen/teichoic acid export membrane protein
LQEYKFSAFLFHSDKHPIFAAYFQRMQRKFITNLALLLFLNLLIKPFWILGIDRAVQNQVGAEEYGLYYALFNFSFLLNILLDLGITNFNNRNIAQHNQLIGKHFPNISSLKLMLGLSYSSITLLAAFVIGYRYGELSLLLPLMFNQFLISFILYLRSNLAGLHFFKADSMMSVLDRFLMIIFCLILLYTNWFSIEFSIQWFIFAQSLAYAITAACGVILVASKGGRWRFNINIPFFFVILKQSFPFAVLVLLMTFYNRIDSVMLERMLSDGAEQSGIYAQGYRLLDAANMISFLFAGLLLPIFSKMIVLRQSVRELTGLAYRLLFSLSVIVALCCYLFSYEIMDLLYVEHADASSPIFSLLMFCFIPVSITYIFGTLLTANGNLKLLNIMALSGMALNITMNLYLIPNYGAKGAAISSLITQSLSALFQIIAASVVFKMRPNLKLVISVSVFLLLLIIPFQLKSYLLNWPLWQSFFLTAFIMASLAIISGLVNFKAVYRIVKYDV